jgi:hypothetical protein
MLNISDRCPHMYEHTKILEDSRTRFAIDCFQIPKKSSIKILSAYREWPFTAECLQLPPFL